MGPEIHNWKMTKRGRNYLDKKHMINESARVSAHQVYYAESVALAESVSATWHI